MNANELQEFLHSHIPISKAIGIEVQEVSAEGVRLAAPLGPNINHRETVFGGSASAVAILSAWSLVYLRLRAEGIAGKLVIQRNTMQYQQPITAGFTAAASIADAGSWQHFTQVLKRKQRARIGAASALYCNGERVGVLEADFVALITPGERQMAYPI